MIVVDGSHTLHRAIFSVRDQDLRDKNGNTTGGIHVFLSMIHKLVRETKMNEGVLICWDSGIPIHRRDINSEYKPRKRVIQTGEETVDSRLFSTLNKTDPSEWEALGVVNDNEFLDMYVFCRTVLHKKLLPYLGCLSINLVNCEADDIISVWCHHLQNKDDITIVSGDRDLNQLLSDSVRQFDGINNRYIELNDFISDNELNEDNWKEEWLIRKSLTGDTSDNIIGFAQLGDTAAKGYARQLVKGIGIDELVRPPRARKEGLINLKKHRSRLDDNKKLIDLNYIIDNDLPLYHEIKSGLAKCSIFDIDEFKAHDVLREFCLTKAALSIDPIIEANSIDPLRQYLRYFL